MMKSTLFNKKLVIRHRERALTQADLDPHSHFLIRETAERLTDRLLDMVRSFERALDISTSIIPLRPFIAPGKVSELWEMAPSPKAAQGLIQAFVGDEEVLPARPHFFDLVLSNLSLHWVNDLPGTLRQIHYALKPDGLFLASLFGGRTLQELRLCFSQAESEIKGGISPRISPFADLRDIAGLLQRAGFALPLADSEIVTVTYDDFYKMLRDVRGMGESNALEERLRYPTSRRFFSRAEEIYRQRFTQDDGRLKATFELIFLTGWAPADSQQQPARRGSGEISLEQFFTRDRSKPE